MDHPEEEPFRSRGRGSCTAAGASGRTCIRNSWGRSRRNTWRGDAGGDVALQPADLGVWAAGLGFRAEGHRGLASWGARGSMSGKVPDTEPRAPDFCAQQNHQGTCHKHRFLGPTPAILAQDARCQGGPGNLHL